MPIPEEQLKAWSNQGATDGSATTYKSICCALDQYAWPEGMKPKVYLQGSYPNSTNTRGNSDVDVVVELDSVCYSNLSEDDKPKLRLTKGRYNFTDFRPHVVKALRLYYEDKLVDDSGGKAVKVLAASGRLNADVIPSVQYKRYESLKVVAEGITFWNQRTKEQVINYPKIHIRNGELKNAAECTKGVYKPSLRMFKNARSRIIGDSKELRKRFPSYFIECLFFNILSLDGGGSKGVYTLGILREVEALAKRPLHEEFNLIYGTSTGAIIAALLALGNDVAQITDTYLNLIPDVMQHKSRSKRSAALRHNAEKIFQDKKFDAFLTDIGIVSTHYDNAKPMI